MLREFSKLCTPARIYFVIAVVATIIALFNGASLMMAFWKLLFALIWTYVLGWLCKKGYKSISWFLVLLPYIIIALAMLNIYRVSKEQKQIMKNVGLQGAYGQEGFFLKTPPIVLSGPNPVKAPSLNGAHSVIERATTWGQSSKAI